MFIKHADGKILSVIEGEEELEKQKTALKNASQFTASPAKEQATESVTKKSGAN